jgi:hypothetical protein
MFVTNYSQKILFPSLFKTRDLINIFRVFIILSKTFAYHWFKIHLITSFLITPIVKK